MTIKQVAETLCVGLSTVYDWTKELCRLDGKPILPTERFGRRGVRVKVTDLDHLETRLAARAGAPGPFSFFSADDATPSNSGGDKR